MSTKKKDGPEHEKLLSSVIQAEDGPGHSGTRLTTCGVDRNFANVLTTAFGFLLLFTAFQTTQMLASSLIGALGQYSLALVYVFFTIGGFFAPAICRRTGPRMGMFLGALTYVVYVASIVYMIVPVFLTTSVLIGCGAACLWTSQGMMMTLSTTNNNKTKYNSIFWGIFNLCVLPGNIAGHFILLASDSKSNTTAHSDGPFAKMVLGWHNPNSELFLLLTIVGGAGAFVLSLVRPSDPTKGSPPVVDTRSAITQIKATCMLVFDPKMICLIPLFTFTGIQMTMWASWFTRQMYATEIGLVMCTFGIAEFIGGFTVGQFVEAHGRSAGLVFGATCGIGAMVLTYVGSQNLADFCKDKTGSAKPCEEYKDYGMFFVAAGLYGFMDCTFQSVAAAICATSFNATKNSADAWALFRTFQAFGAAVSFFISPLLVVKGETYSSNSELIIEIVITCIIGWAALFGHALFSKAMFAPTESKSLEIQNPVYDSPDGTTSVLYSPSVVHNGHLFTSGSGNGGDGNSKNGHTATQARAACEMVQSTLDSAGTNCGKVIKATVYTTEAADVNVVFQIYNEFFVNNASVVPALTHVVAAGLPNQASVQIDVVAVM